MRRFVLYRVRQQGRVRQYAKRIGKSGVVVVGWTRDVRRAYVFDENTRRKMLDNMPRNPSFHYVTAPAEFEPPPPSEPVVSVSRRFKIVGES